MPKQHTQVAPSWRTNSSSSSPTGEEKHTCKYCSQKMQQNFQQMCKNTNTVHNALQCHTIIMHGHRHGPSHTNSYWYGASSGSPLKLPQLTCMHVLVCRGWGWFWWEKTALLGRQLPWGRSVGEVAHSHRRLHDQQSQGDGQQKASRIKPG